jgi:hypothetical protein
MEQMKVVLCSLSVIVNLFHVIHGIVILNMHPSKHFLSHDDMSLPVFDVHNPEMMVM